MRKLLLPLVLTTVFFPNVASGFRFPDSFLVDSESGYGVRMLWDVEGEPLGKMRTYVGWPVSESSHELGLLLFVTPVYPKWSDNGIDYGGVGAFYRYNIPLDNDYIGPYVALDVNGADTDLSTNTSHRVEFGLEAGMRLALFELQTSHWGSDGRPGGIWSKCCIEMSLRLQDTAGSEHRPAFGVTIGLNLIHSDTGN